MIDIARCESNFQQFDNTGAVLRETTYYSHVGLFQIGEKVWGAKAKELGYDIYTPIGNIAMALYIYNKKGTAPWLASKGCWSKGGNSG